MVSITISSRPVCKIPNTSSTFATFATFARVITTFSDCYRNKFPFSVCIASYVGRINTNFISGSGKFYSLAIHIATSYSCTLDKSFLIQSRFKIKSHFITNVQFSNYQTNSLTTRLEIVIPEFSYLFTVVLIFELKINLTVRFKCQKCLTPLGSTYRLRQFSTIRSFVRVCYTGSSKVFEITCSFA